MGIFTMDHCTGTAFGNMGLTGQMTNQGQPDSYKGDFVQFKFALDPMATTACGWFIDNAGVQISNFGIPGSWLSPLSLWTPQ